MSYVLSLSNKNATLENVGGKGMSLSKMLFAGLPVPDGFHVTTESYRHFVSENGIQPFILKLVTDADPHDSAGLDEISRQIGAAFDKGTIPADLKSAISEAYGNMNNAPVAVRSSATAEDLPDASFAGQQDTYLNMHGADEVVSAVKRCWASLWTARAISYRILNDIPQESVELAVVVQKLVFSDAAGVMFTVNPVNGKRGEICISAAWGLGEAVVSGLVTPDTIVLDKKTSRVIYCDVADKEIMTMRTALGTEEAPVDPALRKKPSLSKKHAQELAQLGQKIEDYYGIPMDIEWALEAGKLYIVQARPITILPPEWKTPEENVIYTKGSLAEHLPTPLSPLFSTLGLDVVNDAARLLWDDMFGNSAEKLYPKNGAYQTINGCAYLTANNKPLLLTIKSLSPRQIKKTVKNSVARRNAARDEFAAFMREWENKDFTGLTATQLLQGVTEVFGAASRYFTSIQLTLPAAFMSETFFTKLCKGAIRKGNVSEAGAFLLGFETMALKAEKSLYDISKWAETQPEVTHCLLNSSSGQIMSNPQMAAFKAMIERHLGEFGRTVYEYDFINPTAQELPEPAIDAVRGYLSGKAESPYERQETARRKREQAEKAVLSRSVGPAKWLFKKLLRWAQDTAPMREDAIYDMGMGHPAIRRMLGELDKRLLSGGAIPNKDDIFWLEKAELEDLAQCLDKGMPLSDMSQKIAIRKENRNRHKRYSSPERLPEKTKKQAFFCCLRQQKTPTKPNSAKSVISKTKDGKTLLKGIGTSGGTVTAAARVLHGPQDFSKCKHGDVLIAVTTTPAWTPLFASAGAVVTDIGGPLSHSSIVAREYKIPAVMGVKGATRMIKDGQTVTVDGGAGTVVLHES